MSNLHEGFKNKEIPFTMIPNFIIEKYLSELSGAALKLYLTILRNITGWHKEKDTISYSQFMQISGLSEKSITKSIKQLTELGLLKTIKKGGGINKHIEYFLLYKIEDIKKEEKNTVVTRKKERKTTVKNTVNSEKLPVKNTDTKEIINLNKEEEATNTNINTAQNIQTVNKDTSSFSDLKAILKNYGLTDNQIKKVATEFDEMYIKNKIKQLEFLKKHHPEKIDGEGRYLYNSIIKNWFESGYNENKEKQKELLKQKNKLEFQQRKEVEKTAHRNLLQTLAQEFIERATIEENSKIDKYINSLLQTRFYSENKTAYDIAFKSKKIEFVIDNYINIYTCKDVVVEKKEPLKMSA